MSALWVDLGHGHRYQFFCWKPDRALNPQYAHLPDVEHFGALVAHPYADGRPGECRSAITFEGDVQRALEPEHSRWRVTSWDPLTVEPSLLCRACGDHGFIRGGKWVPA